VLTARNYERGTALATIRNDGYYRSAENDGISGFLLSSCDGHTDESSCPFGLAALVSQELQRQVDSLYLAEPSFCFGSAAA
jgi:hypothetical protein